MKDKTTNMFLNSMIGAVYKILPMNDNEDTTLPSHLDSLYVQLVGGAETYPELKYCQYYHSIINIVRYFRTQEYDKRTCKREVFKCTNILDRLTKL